MRRLESDAMRRGSHKHAGHAHAHEHEGSCEHSEHQERSSAEDADVEKGLTGAERATFSVDGLTCCGRQIEHTLKLIEGVHPSSVRANPATGSVDVLFDRETTSVGGIIKRMKVAGYRCEELSHDQTIDILASRATELGDLHVEGVSRAFRLSKNVVRLAFDPEVIGARTLLRQLGHQKLATHVDPAVATGQKAMYEKLWKTIAAVLLTVPVAVLAWGRLNVRDRTNAIVSLILASLVQLIAVPDFYQPAISALIRNCTIEMDLLVVISISAAYLYSVVAVGFRMAGKSLETKEFFETSTLLITLVLLGRLIASFARVRAVTAVSFRSLQAATATIIEDEKEVLIDARLLQHGDIFKVSPHTTVPTDGEVIRGNSDVDEAMLTGESLPVSKQIGSPVTAGTINGSGALMVRLKRLPGRNTVTDIAELVEEATNSKPTTQDYADKVASWFVPVVSSIAILCFVVWTVVGLKWREQSAEKAIPNAITYCVATLAVSCPCALGLAVPMVLVIAGGIAARNGVVIKSGECTERVRKVTDVVFDKTGTITETDLQIVQEVFLSADQEETVGICKGLVADNKHPVATAVAKHLETRNVTIPHLGNIHSKPGSGIQTVLNGDEVLAGNPRYTDSEDDGTVSKMVQDGMTIMVVTRATEIMAVFGARPRIREEARGVIKELKRRKIDVHIVSGDQQPAVEAVANEVNIKTNIAAQCSPTDKRNYVHALMDKNKVVLFAGDGTNDAVAVAEADFGVQIGDASEVTKSAADVVLLGGLEGIPFLLDISEASFRRMCFNFVWSAIYNVLAILLASGAFVNVRIEPAYAGLGELVSVLPVVFAAASMHLVKLTT